MIQICISEASPEKQNQQDAYVWEIYLKKWAHANMESGEFKIGTVGCQPGDPGEPWCR